MPLTGLLEKSSRDLTRLLLTLVKWLDPLLLSLLVSQQLK